MDERLVKAVNGVKKARQYLDDVQLKYKDEPELLKMYEPTAKELLRRYEFRLAQIVSEETGTNFKAEAKDENADIEIRIVGEQFHKGKGPIGVVGPYLQKINLANQHAVSLLDRKNYKGGRFNRDISNAAMLDLSRLKTGSLILGLNKPEIFVHNEDGELFPPDPWDVTVAALKDSQKAIDGFRLLIKAIASVDQPELLNELKEEFEENEVLKLIHYAKELAPSALSPMDEITFEGEGVGIPSIRTDKQTRKLLDEQAHKLKRGAKYVDAKGFIGVLDFPNRLLLAKPLWIGDDRYKEVRCKLPTDTTTEDMISYAEQVVSMRGFMIYDNNNQPVRLDVDEVSLLIIDEETK